MRRRTFLSSAVVGVAGLAGCTADSEKKEADVPSVDVTSEDHTVDEPVNTLAVRYATDAVEEFEPPDARTYSPDSGNKYVLTHTQITVETQQEQLDVYGSAIALRANGVIHTGRSFAGRPSITQTVVSGATYDGWTAFEVPVETTEATLIPNDVGSWIAPRTTIQFEADESLSASFDE